MRPRTVLLVVAAVSVTGCIAPGASPGTPSSESPTHEPFPEPPAAVTVETVGPYVGEFEEVYRHNAILATADADRITSITVSCNPTNVTARDGGYLVTVECGFGWMFEDEGSAGVADGAPYRATYRVGGDLVERVGSTLGA